MIEVVTIDGPVGVGKSSVAASLAARLNWQHLDTGAMYRAVALRALEGASLQDEAACARLAKKMDLRFEPSASGQRVILGGEDVSDAIRTSQINEAVSTVADIVGVRKELGIRQREMGVSAPSVVEGRDMGTVVFPDAKWKFFLDADPYERACRRDSQMNCDQAEGTKPDPKLLAAIAERDRRDRERPVGALRIAPGAVVIDSTRISLERVIRMMEVLVTRHLS